MTDNILIDGGVCGIRVTRDDAYGLVELRDDSGGLLGFYDSVQDETRDGAGVLLGNGDLLQILLHDQLA